MQIFNIGPLEFVAFLLIALIVLGPERIVSGARSAGRWVNRMVHSPTWQAILTTSREIRDLPQKIVSESGIEDSLKEIEQTGLEVTSELNQAATDMSNDMAMANYELSAQANRIQPPSQSSLALEPPAQTSATHPPAATVAEATGQNASAQDARPASPPPPRSFSDVFGISGSPAASADGDLEPPAQTVIPAEKKAPRKIKTTAPDAEPAPTSLDELEPPAQTLLPAEPKPARPRRLKAPAAAPVGEAEAQQAAPVEKKAARARKVKQPIAVDEDALEPPAQTRAAVERESPPPSP